MNRLTWVKDCRYGPLPPATALRLWLWVLQGGQGERGGLGGIFVLPILDPEGHEPIREFMGRIEKGCDCLGYHISPAGLTVAQQTIERFVTRVTRLYEQSREAPDGASRLGAYVSRWVRWTTAGLRMAGPA